MYAEPFAFVIYSFGGDPGRPGPSNERLAQVAAKIVRQTHATLLVQDHLEGPIRDLELTPDLVVDEHRKEGKFLGTEEVTAQYTEYLLQADISTVLLVAQPFLHRPKCIKLLQNEGFDVETVPTGWVPFDPACTLWWGRSPFHLFFYALFQFAFGRQGH